MQVFSLAAGIGSKNRQGDWLDVFYPAPLLHPNQAIVSAIQDSLGYQEGNQIITLDDEAISRLHAALSEVDAASFTASLEGLKGSSQPRVLTIIAEDTAPKSVPEAYLKLHLLSHRLVKPHHVDLSGVFGLLLNVAWTNEGPIDVRELPQRQLQARNEGRVLSVDSVDKFPKMVDYVVPSGVRIADTARVRLGAHVGEGTTVMHEGFINFNAGTLGTSMVEGRISSGVVIGEGSDLGGGCSTMGTLSGGGNIVISVGEACLLGANAGLGIPLGDRCTIESGLYITAGTKVQLLDDNKQVVKTLKARELAGQDDLLFRRNSISGSIECLTNKNAVALNDALHSNN